MSGKVYDEDDLKRVADMVGEQLSHQLDTVMEAVVDMQGKVARLPQIQHDVAELKADMKAVKAAIRDTNRDLANLDSRVTQLEIAA